MFLALKCNWITMYDAIVLAIELVPSRPTFITEDSDYVYCNLSSVMTDPEIQTNVLDLVRSIGNVHVLNVPSTATEISWDKIKVQGSHNRVIDPEDWINTVRPAWVRAATVVNQFNI